MDWISFSSIVGLFTALTAIVALIYEVRQSRISLQTEALLGLSEKMDSKEIREIRQEAARKLLAKEYPNSELSDILDFFGTIAFLCECKAINNDLAYKEFSWWMIRYWLASSEFIMAERQLDPKGWETLENVVNQLYEREKKEGYSDECYTEKSLQKFLGEEMEKTKCQE